MAHGYLDTLEHQRQEITGFIFLCNLNDFALICQTLALIESEPDTLPSEECINFYTMI